MQRVLITYAKFTDTVIEEGILREAGLEVAMTGPLVTDQLRELARSADALMVGIDRIDADLIQLLDNCKIICRVGTGVDAIDIPAATEKGIWVTNIPDYSIDEVSSHAIALVMADAE